MVLRPTTHQMGNQFHLVSNEEELLSSASLYDEWYASPFIDKEAEYRVFVVQGKVVAVANKIPNDPSAPVWNIHNGTSVYHNVNWGAWPLEVCHKAIKAMTIAELDFGGVDVIVEKETGNSYVLEINSAPSLPFLSDGSVSYRQRCMMKAFQYIFDNDSKETIPTEEVVGWRDVIHPAIWSP